MGDISRATSTAREAAALVLNPRFLGPCVAGVFCLIVATVVGAGNLFTIATALLSLPAASYIMGLVAARGCKCERSAKIVATQGERAAVDIRLWKATGQLPDGLAASDTLPPLIDPAEPVETRMRRQNDAEVRTWIVPRKRGRYAIGPAQMSWSDPLGMFRLKRRIGGTCEVMVYPKPIAIRLSRLSGGAYETDWPSGSGKRAARGDLAGVRDYRRGDELSRVHWKTTARTGRLAVVEYEDSRTASTMIALDLSSGSDFGAGPVTALDMATGVAAYAAMEHLKAGRQVCIKFARGDRIETIRLRSLGELQAALAVLAEVQADSSVSAAELLQSCTKLGGALLVVTRSDERLAAAVRAAKAHGIQVWVAMVDPERYDADIVSRPMVADLMRAGAQVELVPEEMRQ